MHIMKDAQRFNGIIYLQPLIIPSYNRMLSYATDKPGLMFYVKKIFSWQSQGLLIKKFY